MQNFSYLVSIDGVMPRDRTEKLKSAETWTKLYENAKKTGKEELIKETLDEKTRADEEARLYKDLDFTQRLYHEYFRLEQQLLTDREKDLLVSIFLAELSSKNIKLNELKSKFFKDV